MFKIYVYCLPKVHLGVLKVSLCIYLVFGFRGFYLTFLRNDLAFFAYDYLATLLKTNQGSLRAVVIEYVSDPGLRRIRCYTFLITLKYCL